MKINKVVRITLSGGIVGLLATNPRRALDSRIDQENQAGWNAVYFFVPHRETNVLVHILSLIVLVCTLFMWTWGAGYLILFERERASDS